MYHHWLALFLVYLVAVLLAGAIVPGVKIKGVGAAISVVLVFAIANVLIGWLLMGVVGVTLLVPALLTFGLAWLLVPLFANAILLWITKKVVSGFDTTSFGATLGASAILTLAHLVALHYRF